jgi:hypothetical protein
VLAARADRHAASTQWRLTAGRRDGLDILDRRRPLMSNHSPKPGHFMK